jgi:ferredoxin
VSKRLKVNFDLCESNGICEGIAPDVFRLDEDDFLQVSTDEVTAENEARIRDAVASCPRAALSIEE